MSSEFCDEKLFPEDYIGAREDHEDPFVTPSTWNGIQCSATAWEPLTVGHFLFAAAHVFSELRNVTRQLSRIADALESPKEESP